MQRAFDLADLVRQDTPLKTTFNVMMAYEDFETGKQAKRTYDFLAQNLSGEFVLTHQMWKFEVLSIPKLAEIATEDARAADIIIISCRGGNPLPEHIRKWIQGWAHLGTRAQALVALSGAGDFRGPNSVSAFLAEAARKAGLEFFQQPEGEGAASLPVPLTATLQPGPAQTRTFSMLAGAVAHVNPAPRWGINE